jgi:predicted DNA-binding transcriptional regulator AlpA
MITNQYLSLKDLASYINYSPSVVYKNWSVWVAHGLKCFKPCGSPRFRPSDVDKWMDKNRMVTV